MFWPLYVLQRLFYAHLIQTNVPFSEYYDSIQVFRRPATLKSLLTWQGTIKTSTTGTVVPYKHVHTHSDLEYFQDLRLYFLWVCFFFLSVSKVFLLPLSNKGFLNFAKKLQFGDFWRNLVVWWRKRTIWWLSGSILVHQYWGKASVLREKNLWRSP